MPAAATAPGTGDWFSGGDLDYSGTLRFSVSYPLFDRLQRESRVTDAQVQEHNAAASLRDTRLSARQELTQYLGEFVSATERVSSGEATVDAAVEDLRVQQQRYAVGGVDPARRAGLTNAARSGAPGSHSRALRPTRGQGSARSAGGSGTVSRARELVAGRFLGGMMTIDSRLRRPLAIGAVIVAVLGGAWLLRHGLRPHASAASVTVEPVQRRDIALTIEATGTVEPINLIEVKSRRPGQIVRMTVEAGTKVKAGDLLAQIDTRDVKNQYDQSLAALRAAEASSRSPSTPAAAAPTTCSRSR